MGGELNSHSLGPDVICNTFLVPSAKEWGDVQMAAEAVQGVEVTEVPMESADERALALSSLISTSSGFYGIHEQFQKLDEKIVKRAMDRTISAGGRVATLWASGEDALDTYARVFIDIRRERRNGTPPRF